MPTTEARAAQAFAIGDAELGAVRSADDTAAVAGEEAVGGPVERRADVGARVHVDEHRISLADGEQAGLPPRDRPGAGGIGRGWETLGGAVRDVVYAA